MEQHLQAAVDGMRKHGFKVVELETAAQAKEYLLGAIAAGSSVGVGGSVSVRDTDVLPALEADYNRPAASAAEGMLLPIDADSGVLVGNYWQVNISCFFTLDLVRNLIGFD